MKLKSIALVVSLFVVNTLFSQNSSLKGSVFDENGSPLPFANILVYNTDNQIQNGLLTAEDGSFIIEPLQTGSYTINISFIGYTTYSQKIEIIDRNILLPQIDLKKDSITLDGITVIGYRKLIRNKEGKITLNVDNSKLSLLPSTNMLMSFVPGIIQKGESFTVVGRGTPLIYIDRRIVKDMSQISSLQPEKIKSITVDRNPSAKYDGEYNSIVHINTKKTKERTFSIQYAQGGGIGGELGHSEQVNINHSTEKWTNFLSYKFKQNKTAEDIDVFQYVVTNEILQHNSFNSKTKSNKDLHNLVFGSNVKLSDHHTLDVQYFFNTSNNKYDVEGLEMFSGVDNYNLDVLSNGQCRNITNTANLNYQWEIDSMNTLNLYADYSNIQNQNNELVENSSLANSQIDKYDIKNISHFDTYSFRGEYETSIASKFQFNLGANITSINSNINSHINQTALNTNESTRLKERTISLYTTLKRDINRYSIEAGVRAEFNRSEYSTNSFSVFEKPRILNNILPSLSISYDASSKVQLYLNYTNKINRAKFSELNPSIEYLSSALYQQGNPELKPELNNTIEVGGTFCNKLNVSIGYSAYKNTVAYIIEPSAGDETYLLNRPININKSSSLDLNASYYFMIKKWQSNIMGNISIPFMEYRYLGKNISNNLPQLQLINTNMYFLSPTIFFACNFVAQNRYNYLNSEFSPTYNLILAANLMLFKGKLNLTIFANDLLNKSQSNTLSQWKNVSTGQTIQTNNRIIGLSIKLNINKFRSTFRRNESNENSLKRIL